MAILPVAPDQLETFTIVTNPSRAFVTSSLGATGSVYVFSRRSTFDKDVDESASQSAPFSDAKLGAMQQAIASQLTSSTNIFSSVASYLSAVNSHTQASRELVSLPVFRYTPTNTFTENTLRKNFVRKSLSQFYRTDYPTANWGYTNYHCISMFTASTVSSQAAILYPNVVDRVSLSAASGTYALTGAFTFDFYVNPRYRSSQDHGNFHASTLVHLSSSYAVSIVSGSQLDQNGRTAGFRVQLQLSHSADVKPSQATPGAFPRDLIFQSDDNSLQWNNWHHVIIRWGGPTINGGTGSILVDGRQRGTFVVPSASIAPASYGGVQGNPDALCVGNYYEGTNRAASAQSYFFSDIPATRAGVIRLNSDTTTFDPQFYTFAHPFNADFHDLVIRRSYLTDDVIVSGSGLGLPTVDQDVAFWLPPFFTKESPYRKYYAFDGGVLQTPFFSIDGVTDDPFNVAMSFGVGGHYINAENFVMDFSTGNWPRLINMTLPVASVSTTTAKPANEFIYENTSAVRRNMFVMPCDDGNFVPNFDMLATASNGKYVDDIGAADNSWITLNDLIPTASLFNYVTDESGSNFSKLAGPMPESPGVAPGQVLTIFQRTRDNSSNQVTFFDISNLYYGLRIKPGTFELIDPSFTGSNGALSMTLHDDGKGNLFRANCATAPATWNSVGSIFYNEGIVAIKSPHLNFFGKEGFSVSFKGEQTIHTMRLNVFAEAGLHNSSSNPSYTPMSASFNANEGDGKFVYISDVYMMDRDHNVVMKTALAQPVLKRTNDRLMFKIKMDF